MYYYVSPHGQSSSSTLFERWLLEEGSRFRGERVALLPATAA
jgi:hypothetical protein